MRHHHRYRHHHRHSRFSSPWYWATGAAIAEAAFWAAIPAAIALWWLLWAAAYGATIATRRIWHLTQPADGTEPRWQQALDAARPSWPKRTRRITR